MRPVPDFMMCQSAARLPLAPPATAPQHGRGRLRACVLASSLVLLGVCAHPTVAYAQGLTWGRFETAVPFGSGSTAVSQSLPATISGAGPGSGSATLTLSVAGGSGAWNGFGIARNDDGYYAAPDLPVPGITFVSGAPGYGGGIPLLAAVSFASGYRLAGAPAATPAPPSDRAGLYFDAGDGTTATLQWEFSTLRGGVLPTGSWLFLDGVDQGERVVANGPDGWVDLLHFGDSTLTRPASPFPVPVSVSEPDFPACTPAVTQTGSTLQLDGRYGDISTAVPTCSSVPVPVPGQTVGYTKGADAVGVWVRTALPLTSLSLTIIDTDPSTSNGSGGYTGPDNNYVVGIGLIVRVGAPPAVPLPLSAPLALLALLLGLSGLAWRSLRSARA